MRHGYAGNRLSRNRSLFKATIRDLAKATLVHQRIKTTSAKAKQARKMVEKLITMGKSGTLADKRHAFAILCDHNVVSGLFNTTAPLFKNRQGGYTRIIRLSTKRRGDNAQEVLLELTEKWEVTGKETKTAKAKKNQPIDVAAETHTHDHEHTHEHEAPKEKTSKKETTKAEKGPIQKQEKGNTGKNLVGGIRKMFNRKTGGGG
jgi:large subunit ribosomal protein L17